MKTKAEARQLWLAAMRSGKYRQGTGQLKFEKDGEILHCCLGIACEVYMETEGVQEFETIFNPYGEAPKPGLIHYGFGPPKYLSWRSLPTEVIDWLGLRDGMGTLRSDAPRLIAMPHCPESLAGGNDAHIPFNELADYIEQHPEAVFLNE